VKSNKNIVLTAISLHYSVCAIAQNEKTISPPPPPPTIEIVKEIFIAVPNMPRFPGCEETGSNKEKEECANEKMMKFLYKNLKYPNEARDNGITGSVIASFVVEPSGEISNEKIEKGLTEECDEEALRVIKLMRAPELR